MQTLHCERCFLSVCSQGDMTQCSEVTVNGAKPANSKSTEKRINILISLSQTAGCVCF